MTKETLLITDFGFTNGKNVSDVYAIWAKQNASKDVKTHILNY